MSTTVERTALAAFHLNGLPVRPGQVVTLDAIQLAKLSAAGCVERSEELNAAVPKAELPPTEAEAVNGSIDVEQARAAEARQTADAEIAEIDRRTAERRVEATAELDQFNTDHQAALVAARGKADQELAAVNASVTEARGKADAELLEISGRVNDARSRADAEIAEIEKEVATAKSGKSNK